MNRTRAGVLSPILLGCLLGCATGPPTYGPADEKEVNELLNSHRLCVEEKAQPAVLLADNAKFLAQRIVEECDQGLSPMRTYLRERGFDNAFIEERLNRVRAETTDKTAALILQKRAGR